MPQIIEQGPTEHELRQRAFQQGLNQMVKHGGQAFDSIKRAEAAKEMQRRYDEQQMRQQQQDELAAEEREFKRARDIGQYKTPEHLAPTEDVDQQDQYENFTRFSQLADAYKGAGIRDRNAKNVAKISKVGPTAAEKAFEGAAAKDIAEYEVGGGKQTAEKNLVRLQGAIDRMEAKGEMAGGISTKLPWLKGDDQQDWINPELSSVRDDIRSAIQGSLKATLGAQFTEKEAEQIFSRAFNPRLSDAENVRRAKIELQALQGMAKNKEAAAQHFRKYRSLSGFRPSVSPEIAPPPMFADAPPPQGFKPLGVQPSVQTGAKIPMVNQAMAGNPMEPAGNPADPARVQQRRDRIKQLEAELGGQ